MKVINILLLSMPLLAAAGNIERRLFGKVNAVCTPDMAEAKEHDCDGHTIDKKACEESCVCKQDGWGNWGVKCSKWNTCYQSTLKSVCGCVGEKGSGRCGASK